MYVVMCPKFTRVRFCCSSDHRLRYIVIQICKKIFKKYLKNNEYYRNTLKVQILLKYKAFSPP